MWTSLFMSTNGPSATSMVDVKSDIHPNRLHNDVVVGASLRAKLSGISPHSPASWLLQ
ncbi:hypothetical protein FQZ97_612190 [compost metagenome]